MFFIGRWKVFFSYFLLSGVKFFTGRWKETVCFAEPLQTALGSTLSLRLVDRYDCDRESMVITIYKKKVNRYDNREDYAQW